MLNINVKKSVKKFLVVSVASLGLIAPAVLPTVSTSVNADQLSDLVGNKTGGDTENSINNLNDNESQYQGNASNPTASDIKRTANSRANGSNYNHGVVRPARNSVKPARHYAPANRGDVTPAKPAKHYIPTYTPAQNTPKVAPAKSSQSTQSNTVAPKQHVIVPKRTVEPSTKPATKHAKKVAPKVVVPKSHKSNKKASVKPAKHFNKKVNRPAKKVAPKASTKSIKSNTKSAVKPSKAVKPSIAKRAMNTTKNVAHKAVKAGKVAKLFVTPGHKAQKMENVYHAYVGTYNFATNAPKGAKQDAKNLVQGKRLPQTSEAKDGAIALMSSAIMAIVAVGFAVVDVFKKHARN